MEISFIKEKHLKQWVHPCSYEFHYSEYWRERFEKDLSNGTYFHVNKEVHTDPDLAAHLTIIHQRGVCVEGKPLKEIFPVIPTVDYLSAIKADFEECLENIQEDPIYCSLNMMRMLLFRKEGRISSKQEAGIWALTTFPEQVKRTVQKVVDGYQRETGTISFDKNELITLRDYINSHLQVVNSGVDK